MIQNSEDIRAVDPNDTILQDVQYLKNLEKVQRRSAPDIDADERAAIQWEGMPSDKNTINTLSKFRFMQAGELLQEPKPINWLIKYWMEKNSLSSLFAETGKYKSFVALDQGLCISSGRHWHGHKVSKGSVFYIAGEGFSGLARRIRAWEIHLSLIHI